MYVQELDLCKIAVVLHIYDRSNCISIVNEHAIIEKGRLLLTPLPGQK
jgi:hypothetical protein